MSMSWPVVALSEVLRKSEESVPIDLSATYREVTIKLWGKGVVLRREASGSEIAAPRRSVVRTGQFILSRIDARNGAFGIVPPALDGAVVSNDFPAFNLNTQRIIPEYLGWLSKSADFVDLCKASSEGTTNRVRLKEEKFLATAIALPSLEEQQRIVARIEELTAKLEEAWGLRRQAVKEAESLISRAIDDVFSDESYQEHPLGELLREKSRNGLSARPMDMPPGTAILRISAGTSRTDGIVDEDDHKYLDVGNKKISDYSLQPGDLLACRFNGNLHYVGRFSLFMGTSKSPRLYPDKLIRFRVNTARVLPEYVKSVMNSPKGRTKIEAFCQTTAGNIGISAGNLNSISIPVPPILEQRRIVTYLDNLHAKVDTLMRLQAETATELDAMLPSILAKAFKGAL